MKYIITAFFIVATAMVLQAQTDIESERMVDQMLGRTNAVTTEEPVIENISDMDFSIESMTLLRESDDEQGTLADESITQPGIDIGTGDYARVEILKEEEASTETEIAAPDITEDVIEETIEEEVKRPVTIPVQGTGTVTGIVTETVTEPIAEQETITEKDIETTAGGTTGVIEETETYIETFLEEETAAAGTGATVDITTEVVTEEKRGQALRPGALVGKVTSHKGTPLAGVKVVLFSDESYHSMKTTPGGNFGFSIISTNNYTLTASFGNEFFYTNLYLIPARGAYAAVQFVMPITVYGKLFIDEKPAQYGMLLRFINNRGAQAGGIVLSNGLFTVKRMTPGRYVMVCERRKRFIDNRINEQRFYYTPMTVTTDTMRIELTRDRRKLRGQINIDGLPRRYVDAIVIMKDARTDGLLIHREVPTYYEDGVFEFNHVQPGRYRLQAVQRQREWVSREVLINVPARATVRRVTLDVITDPDAHRKYIDDLKKQFLD